MYIYQLYRKILPKIKEYIYYSRISLSILAGKYLQIVESGQTPIAQRQSDNGKIANKINTTPTNNTLLKIKYIKVKCVLKQLHYIIKKETFESAVANYTLRNHSN